ncbi:MAG: hypothetical protein ACPKM0_06210 [Pleomorphochaeta sp.]
MGLLQGDYIHYQDANYKDCDTYIVISHSCDIDRPKEKEPFIELLPCHLIEQIDGNTKNGKTARQLNFETNLNGKEYLYNIIASEKIFVEKSKLINIKAEKKVISNLTLFILQNWLAARYRRESLPESINNLFRNVLKLPKKLNNYKMDISAIFIDVDKATETYEVFFVINTEIMSSESKVENFVKSLNTTIQKYSEYKNNVTITPRIDLDFNYNEVSNYTYYNLDYLCEE